MRTSHERKITGAASIIGAATALSRVLGYIRDACIAYVFGAGLYADAFFMAFRISNLLRRLVGEGALTSSFIPIFTGEIGARKKEEVRELASSVFTLFALILAVLTVLGVIFSKELIWLMAPGFVEDPEKFNVTVGLTRVMFPYMLFIGLMAIAMGVLNSYKHFTGPALAPVFLNIAIIASVFGVAPFLDSPVYSLAIGVLAGGVLQLLLQAPYLKRFGMLPYPSFRFRDSAIRKIFVLMGPATLGIGVYQLNNFISLWFSSHLPEGAVSYLYYAGRLMELPLGVFAVAISTAVLPSLSEHAAEKDWDAFRGSLSFAVRLVNFVTIPATVGLIVLNGPIVDLLFKRGVFGVEDSAGTAIAVFYYALGLVPVAVSRIVTSVFYSVKDTATPVWAAVATVVANAVFCLILVGPMGHGGLALATSISSAINCAILLIVLRMKFGRFEGRAIVASSIKSLIASAVMGAVIYAVAFQTGLLEKGFVATAVVVSVCLGVGFITYVIASRALGVTEVAFLKGILRKEGEKGGQLKNGGK